MIAKLLFVMVVLLIMATSAAPQSLDGGSISRAGVHDLELKSSQALAFNPAILGSTRNHLYCIEFLNSSVAIINSAFSTAYWNQNIAGDRYLDQNSKAELLDKIGADGISVDGRATFPIAGLAYKHFAFRVAIDSYGSGLIPRDAAEILLQGNELGKEYSVNALRGESATLLDVGLGLGHAFNQDRIKTLAFGVAAHYYQGLQLAKLTQTAGSFSVTDSLITGSTYLRSVESTLGDGVGFDLGVFAEFNDRWQCGVSLRQIGVQTSWTVKTNRILSAAIDSGGVNIDSLDQDEYLDRVFQSQDTSYSGGTVDTKLPATLTANGRFVYSKKLTLLAEFSYVSRGSPTDHSEVALGFASQWKPRNWLVIQDGLTVGSLWDLQVGIGTGLRFTRYELDIGWSWNGGLFNHARGISLGMTHRINF